MTSPEKIGIVAVVLFVAVLGYFLFHFLSDDSGESATDLEVTPAETSVEEDPVVESRIEGADDLTGREGITPRTDIVPDREEMGGAPTFGIAFGRVVDGAGKPIEGAALTLRQGASSILPHLPAQKKVDVDGKSDSKGRFDLVGIESGNNYIIVANHENYAETTFSPLNIRAGQRVEVPDIVMGRGVLVKGLVTDTHGSPLIGALVQIRDPIRDAFRKKERRKPWKQVFTDATGQYRFENISFKTFELTASADGYATQAVSHNVQFESKKEKEVNFQLNVGSFISGMVLDTNGTPLDAVQVEATLVQNKEFTCSGTVLSGENGSFQIQGLAEGSYVVRASKKEYSDDVKQGVQTGTVNVEMVLSPRGGVSGVVRDWETLEPITKFEVRVLKGKRGGEGQPPRPTKIVEKFEDKEGRYAIEDLDPGAYSFEVSADGYADCHSDEVSVVRDYTINNVDIYMNKGGDLTGRVVDKGGEPISGVKVALNDNKFQDNPLFHIFSAMAGPEGERKKKSVFTRADGTFHLKLIVPGTYQLALSHDEYTTEAINDVQILLGEGVTPSMGDLVMTEGARVFGTVRDGSGALVPGATVVITSTTANMKQTTTDKKGFYSAQHLIPGEYTISVQVNRLKGKDLSNVFTRLMIAEKSKVTVYLEEGSDFEANVNLVE